MIKRVLSAAVVLFLGVLFGKTLMFSAPPERPARERAPALTLRDGAIDRFKQALEFPTVSHEDPALDDAAAFAALRQHLEASFPLAFGLPREDFGRSLLIRWEGSDAALKPVLFLAHLDVVPVEPSTEKDWTAPPFSGREESGFIHGRGTLDDKGAALAIFESIEALSSSGFKPARTLYFAFGADEEVGGRNGMSKIHDAMKDRGLRFSWVLDEGMAVTKGIVPNVAGPVALIGIAEKGSVSVRITAKGQGGHSSMPPDHTAAGVLAAAIAKLEANPFPATLDGPASLFFDFVGPHLPFAQKLVMANRWLLGGLLKGQLLKKPSTAALLRTTTAVTMLEGGVKENVLPQSASAVVNFRIRPGETGETVIARVKAVLAGSSVSVEAAGSLSSDPSPVSSIDHEGFTLLRQTIREQLPVEVVAPSLTLGVTDSRHFNAFADDIYRFTPWTLEQEDLARVHGTNERISVAGYLKGISFYAALIRGAGQPARSTPSAGRRPTRTTPAARAAE